LGSDKFAVLLTATELRDGLKQAEILRAALAGAGSAPASDPAPISVSIGLADAIGTHDETATLALERAGDALFRAKREGGNRTKVAHPPRPRLIDTGRRA
jgi:diguanylate cyclase (GGDEF)-like protein